MAQEPTLDGPPFEPQRSGAQCGAPASTGDGPARCPAPSPRRPAPRPRSSPRRLCNFRPATSKVTQSLDFATRRQPAARAFARPRRPVRPCRGARGRSAWRQSRRSTTALRAASARHLVPKRRRSEDPGPAQSSSSPFPSSFRSSFVSSTFENKSGRRAWVSVSDCHRRHRAMRAWSPLCSTAGTLSPFHSTGRV